MGRDRYSLNGTQTLVRYDLGFLKSGVRERIYVYYNYSHRHKRSVANAAAAKTVVKLVR